MRPYSSIEVNICAIIQARLHSTRLPGKMLKPLAGRPLLRHVIDRVKRCDRITDAVVAVPYPDHHTFIQEIGHCGIGWVRYAGMEHDLVGRYIKAAQVTDADVIVRVPGDNPCVDPEVVDMTIETFLKHPNVCLSSAVVPMGDDWVDGLGCEVFTHFRLRWLEERLPADDPSREHPHTAFGRFNCFKELFPHLCHATLRLDVNTPRDYDFMSLVFDYVYPKSPHFESQEVVEAAREIRRRTSKPVRVKAQRDPMMQGEKARLGKKGK